MTSSARAVYAAGALLFLRGATLMAQRIDLTCLPGGTSIRPYAIIAERRT